MSSLRDLGFQSAPTPTYTTTMPRGPFLQRHFSGISSHDLQNNNEPPPIRPRKPPRLIHYAQGGTLTRNNFTLGKIHIFCQITIALSFYQSKTILDQTFWKIC